MDQHRVWEAIAASFDASRDRKWPHVLNYLERAPAGRVLDLMAGNGRHLATRGDHEAIWFDWTRPLAREMQGRYDAEVVVGDAARLPFTDGSIAACTYVAGLHGIPTATGRADSLNELRRILRVGGTAQITVWSRHAPKFKHMSGKGSIDANIPWKSGGHDENRYYRLYTLEDLRAECEASGLTVTRAEHVAVVAKEGWDNEMVEVIKP